MLNIQLQLGYPFAHSITAILPFDEIFALFLHGLLLGSVRLPRVLLKLGPTPRQNFLDLVWECRTTTPRTMPIMIGNILQWRIQAKHVISRRTRVSTATLRHPYPYKPDQTLDAHSSSSSCRILPALSHL
jgi:hypothetical protein